MIALYSLHIFQKNYRLKIKQLNQLFWGLDFALPKEKASIPHTESDNGDIYIILTSIVNPEISCGY